ncbi:MAG: RidA family protein [Chloroflexi bacterium]|nr:RidA family protein [Chloroflexota bacterium]
MAERQLISPSSPFEPVYGYSRAVRVGNVVHVAGTVAWGDPPNDSELIGAGDMYVQAKQAIRNIESALKKAGSSLRDVVRTRAFITDISIFSELSRAHVEAFGEIRPAATVVEVSRLATPEMLVEIEADAIIGSG